MGRLIARWHVQSRAEDVVEEMVQGTLMFERSLCRVGNLHVLARADYKPISAKQVAILSGGGSGHEPAHAGEDACFTILECESLRVALMLIDHVHVIGVTNKITHSSWHSAPKRSSFLKLLFCDYELNEKERDSF
jgi:dihydroxyacetone kinase